MFTNDKEKQYLDFVLFEDFYDTVTDCGFYFLVMTLSSFKVYSYNQLIIDYAFKYFNF